MNRLPFALAAVLLLGLAGCRSDDPGNGILSLTFGHVGAPGSLFAVSAEDFARRVQEKLGDRVRVDVFGSSQLGSDGVMLQKLKLGTLDFALPSTIMSSQIDEFGLFEMPYLVRDRWHMRRIEAEIFWPRLAPLAGPKGFKILAVWENGFRHITNNRRPIRVPADLEGIKLRTPRGLWRVKMFQSYGANPTPMALADVFVALETGVMDGQENPFAQIWSSRFHEVQRYLSLTGHVYTPAFVTVGAKRWMELPEDVRTALEATCRETQDFVYTSAARMEEDLLAKLEEAGLEVNEADRESFAEASREIYETFSESVPGGGELIESALALGGP